MSLTSFERKVLALFLDHEGRAASTLREQVEATEEVSRKMTGVGFQTEIDPPKHVVTADGLDAVLGGITGRHPNDPDPLLFNLFIREGKLTLLEGLALSNVWPADEEMIVLDYPAYGRQQNQARLGG